MNFSDYVVYADESGDHSLTSINPQNPVFVLAFCIFEKRAYVDMVVPMVQRLKFDFFGHDCVVLHGHEIRKAHGEFKVLLNAEASRFPGACKSDHSRFASHDHCRCDRQAAPRSPVF
jgi:hypothetical protein